jgi:hypothetical protein
MKRLLITALWLSSNIVLVNDAFGETRTTNGTASLFEHIGDMGCPLYEDPRCKSGETCRVGFVLQGEIASRLYDLLSKHGVERNDDLAEWVGGAYATTSDDLIFCSDRNGEKTCSLVYDPFANKAATFQVCE